MMKHMQKVLEEELSAEPEEPEAPRSLQGPPTINGSLLEARIQHLRESVCSRLGSDVFHGLYESLKEARRQQQDGGDGVTEALTHLEDKPEDGLQVDQLLFYEEELQRVRRLQDDSPPV
ncbi:serine/threonine-protein kinase Nek11-like [Pagrus major]|uniref:serine/threonine-protein kinase Nek11-like n=1 Tax=Pagrus major TaxID=143350 RepID=UPI003CC8BED0